MSKKREYVKAVRDEKKAPVEKPAEAPKEKKPVKGVFVNSDKYVKAIRSRHKDLPAELVQAILDSESKGAAKRLLKGHLQRKGAI